MPGPLITCKLNLHTLSSVAPEATHAGLVTTAKPLLQSAPGPLLADSHLAHHVAQAESHAQGHCAPVLRVETKCQHIQRPLDSVLQQWISGLSDVKGCSTSAPAGFNSIVTRLTLCGIGLILPCLSASMLRPLLLLQVLCNPPTAGQACVIAPLICVFV